MDYLSCGICMEIFDEKERIPKCLKCGHTLCALCLANIKECCPKCKKEVSTAEEEVITNFFLLSLLPKVKSSLHEEMIKRDFKETEELLLLKKSSIEDDLSTIRKTASAEGCSMSNQEKEDLLKEVRERNSALGEVTDQQSPNCLLLESFGSTTEFLYHVAHLLHQKKKVYACHRVGNHLKYGQLSRWSCLVWKRDSTNIGNVLIMTSLSASQVEEDAALIWYLDLQKCLTTENFLICLIMHGVKDGKGDYDHCFCPNESRILPQLIQLCTGEKGPTYRGTKYTVVKKGAYEHEVSVSDYVVDGVPTKGCIDPFLNLGPGKSDERHDTLNSVSVYTEVNKEGQLKIMNRSSYSSYKMNDCTVFYSTTNLIPHFLKEFEGTIFDSGIAFKL